MCHGARGLAAGSRLGPANEDPPPGRREPSRAVNTFRPGVHKGQARVAKRRGRVHRPARAPPATTSRWSLWRVSTSRGTAMLPTRNDLDEAPEQVPTRSGVSGSASLRRHERPHRPVVTAPAGGHGPALPTRRLRAVSTPHACRYWRLSSGLRLRSDTTRNSSRQAGSARQAESGAARPASTVSAVAGSRGTNQVRTHHPAAPAARRCRT